MERKEAIDIIKKNWPDNSFTMLQEALETLIPELKESEDERIRKALIEACKQSLIVGGFHKDKVIAWLEKQGEPNKQTFWEKCNHCEYFDGYDICLHKKNFGSVTNESKENCRKNNFFIEKQVEQKPIKEHNACDFCEDRYECVNPCPTKLIEKEKPAEDYPLVNNLNTY